MVNRRLRRSLTRGNPELLSGLLPEELHRLPHRRRTATVASTTQMAPATTPATAASGAQANTAASGSGVVPNAGPSGTAQVQLAAGTKRPADDAAADGSPSQRPRTEGQDATTRTAAPPVNPCATLAANLAALGARLAVEGLPSGFLQPVTPDVLLDDDVVNRSIASVLEAITGNGQGVLFSLLDPAAITIVQAGT